MEMSGITNIADSTRKITILYLGGAFSFACSTKDLDILMLVVPFILLVPPVFDRDHSWWSLLPESFHQEIKFLQC